MKLTLDKPKPITVVPAQIITTDTVLINQVTDTGTHVVALITPVGERLSDDNRTISIILWDGDAYKNIGQWTDTDVVNRLKELL